MKEPGLKPQHTSWICGLNSVMIRYLDFLGYSTVSTRFGEVVRRIWSFSIRDFGCTWIPTVQNIVTKTKPTKEVQKGGFVHILLGCRQCLV